MRVAFLTNFIPPYLTSFFRRLSLKVDNLTIFVSTKMEPNRPWKANWAGINVIQQKAITIQRTWYHPTGFSDQIFVHFPYDTLNELYKFKPQVIISGEMGLRSILAFVYKKIFPSVKLIIWARVSTITEQGRGKIRKFIRETILPKTDAIIVNGNNGKRYIEQFGINSERIFIVNLPVDNELFLKTGSNKIHRKYLHLLFVGQIIHRKGLDRFLAQLSKFLSLNHEYQCELWNVGDGNQKKELADYNKIANLEIQFFGNIDYGKLPNFYCKADVLIFPTLADEWGYVVNEAMAAKLPVFGSKYSQAVEELIVDQVNGWVYDPLDEENTQAKLAEMFTASREKFHEMGENAFQTISKVTIDHMVQQFSDVIYKVCDDKNNNHPDIG